MQGSAVKSEMKYAGLAPGAFHYGRGSLEGEAGDDLLSIDSLHLQ
jgi:hypothetical protein